MTNRYKSVFDIIGPVMVGPIKFTYGRSRRYWTRWLQTFWRYPE